MRPKNKSAAIFAPLYELFSAFSNSAGIAICATHFSISRSIWAKNSAGVVGLLCMLALYTGCKAEDLNRRVGGIGNELVKTVIREQGIPAAEAAIGSLKQTSAQGQHATAAATALPACPYCGQPGLYTDRETGAYVCAAGHNWGGMPREAAPDPYAAYRAALESGEPFDVLIVGEGCPGCEAVKRMGRPFVELQESDDLAAQIFTGWTIPQLVRYNADGSFAGRFTGAAEIRRAWAPKSAAVVCPCGCGLAGCSCGKGKRGESACQSCGPSLRVRRRR